MYTHVRIINDRNLVESFSLLRPRDYETKQEPELHQSQSSFWESRTSSWETFYWELIK